MDQLNLKIKKVKKVKVSFYDPFTIYPSVKHEIESKLPLTSLHLKLNDNTPLRSISKLDVEFVEEIPNSIKHNPIDKAIDAQMNNTSNEITSDDKETMNLINSINDSYLKIMLFETSNMEHYKQVVRPFIKEWFRQSVNNCKLPTDWLLLFYVPKGQKDDQTTAFKYSLLDKIKLDFSEDATHTTNNNLKIMKLKHDYSNQDEKIQAYNIFFNSLKSGIINSFVNRIKFFELKISQFVNRFRDDDNSSDDGKTVFTTNINIGLYFLLNENLAILYHDLNLYEDSLIEYEKLEEIFAFYLKKGDLNIEFSTKIGFENDIEKNVFYENFGSTNDNFYDVASKIFEYLTIFRKPMFDSLRKKMVNNEITYFELKNYLFLKQVILVDLLIFNDNDGISATPSINIIYINDLLKRLKKFVNQLFFEILTFNDPTVNLFKLIEFNYTIVENYLFFIQEFFFNEQNNKSFEIYSNNEELNDCIGQLRLVQRFFVILLGKYFDYHLDNYIIDQLTDFKIKSYLKLILKEKEIIFSNPSFKSIFESFDSFCRCFRTLTELTINNYNISDKPRNVDLLSLDIALLNYQVGNYDESLMVLKSCPGFYNEQGWEYIAFYLLRIFINCLEKLLEKGDNFENKTMLVKSLFEFSSILIESSNKFIEVDINNNLHNINKFLTSNHEINKIIDQIEYYKGSISIEHELSRIYHFKIFPVMQINEVNTYSIEIEVDNFLLYNTKKNNTGLLFDAIELILQNIDEEDETLVFNLAKSADSESMLRVDKGKNKIILSCLQIIIGKFVPKNLNFYIGNIKLGKYFDGTSNMIFIYPVITNLNFEIKNLLSLNLNLKKFILQVNVADFSINNLKIEIMPNDSIEFNKLDVRAIYKKRLTGENEKYDFDDYNLINASSTRNLLVKSDVQNLLFEVDDAKIDPYSFVEIIIPYTTFSAVSNIIALRCKVTADDKYSITSDDFLNSSLSIAVSVQDTFKSDKLFSKFSIGNSDPKVPVRILDTRLLSNEHYKTSTGIKPKRLISFNEQPISQFFRIEPQSDSPSTASPSTASPLLLTIDYRNLNEEIFFKIWNHFKVNYLKNNSKYFLLFKNYLFKLFEFDLNQYALFGKVILVNFSINQFNDIFKIIQLKFLEDFQKFTTEISETKIEDVDYASITRELTIDVPVPLIQIIHTIFLEFEQKSQYVVGEPIPVNLKISSSLNWRGANEDTSTSVPMASIPKKKKVLFADPNKDISLEKFLVELSQNENWLISGIKKFNFSVDSSVGGTVDQPDMQLFLIPLKIGKVILPRIDIKSINNHLNDEFHVELDYKNSSQTVLIVPNLDRVTFAF